MAVMKICCTTLGFGTGSYGKFLDVKKWYSYHRYSQV